MKSKTQIKIIGVAGILLLHGHGFAAECSKTNWDSAQACTDPVFADCHKQAEAICGDDINEWCNTAETQAINVIGVDLSCMFVDDPAFCCAESAQQYCYEEINYNCVERTIGRCWRVVTHEGGVEKIVYYGYAVENGTELIINRCDYQRQTTVPVYKGTFINTSPDC